MNDIQAKPTMPSPRLPDGYDVVATFTCGFEEPTPPEGIVIDVSDGFRPYSAVVTPAPIGPKPEPTFYYVTVTDTRKAFCASRFYRGDRVEARVKTDGSFDLKRVNA